MSRESVMDALRRFRFERNWEQFHTPDALAKSIAIEAGELLECFQWPGQPFSHDDVCAELADILTYAYFLADRLGEDPEALMMQKLQVTAVKYPVNGVNESSSDE